MYDDDFSEEWHKGFDACLAHINQFINKMWKQDALELLKMGSGGVLKHLEQEVLELKRKA